MITSVRACPFTEDVSIRFTWAWAVFEIESRTKQMKRPTRQLSAGFAAAVLILLSGHSTIFASMPRDEHWSPEFGWPRTGDIVNRIARWDGTNWSDLGNGITNPDGSTPSVSALAVNANDIYIGGLFQR